MATTISSAPPRNTPSEATTSTAQAATGCIRTPGDAGALTGLHSSARSKRATAATSSSDVTASDVPAQRSASAIGRCAVVRPASTASPSAGHAGPAPQPVAAPSSGSPVSSRVAPRQRPGVGAACLPAGRARWRPTRPRRRRSGLRRRAADRRAAARPPARASPPAPAGTRATATSSDEGHEPGEQDRRSRDGADRQPAGRAATAFARER